MQSWKSGLFGFLCEIIQRFLCLFGASQAVDERVQFVDAEDRFAVYFVIGRVFEILIDHSVHHDIELFPIYFAVPDDRVFTRIIHIPVSGRIVIRPHQIEVHAPVVGFQKAVIDAILQKGLFIEPVPVEDKSIHSIF